MCHVATLSVSCTKGQNGAKIIAKLNLNHESESYIFLVRRKLVKTCFNLLKSFKTRLGLFQINFQITKSKNRSLDYTESSFLQFHQRKKFDSTKFEIKKVSNFERHES